jgi:hypothetical protein
MEPGGIDLEAARARVPFGSILVPSLVSDASRRYQRVLPLVPLYRSAPQQSQVYFFSAAFSFARAPDRIPTSP